MGVRVSNVTPKCCKLDRCVNDPILTWDPVASGGTASKAGSGWVLSTSVASVTSFARVIDLKSRRLRPDLNFCFSTTLEKNTGLGSILSGFATNDFSQGNVVPSQFIGILNGSSKWNLAWTKTSFTFATTTVHPLIDDDFDVAHTFKICRVGNFITVQVDGQTFKFPIDSNYPTSRSMLPFTEVSDLGIGPRMSSDFTQFCFNQF